MYYKCKYEGCPVKSFYEEGIKEHEEIPHVRCKTCARFFTVRGLSAHVSHIERKGLEHIKVQLIS